MALLYAGVRWREGSAPEGVLAQARELKAKGEFDAARALLLPLQTHEDVATRAQALSLLARIAWSRGDADRAITTFREAEHLARKASLPALAAANVIARADTLRRHRGDLAAARLALSEVVPDLLLAPEFTPDHAYQRALVERDAGLLREAQRWFDEAVLQAQVHHQPSLVVDVEQVRAPIDLSLGQQDQAFARLRQLAKAHMEDPCQRAHLLTNLGWLSIVSVERSGGTPDYAAIEEGERLYGTTCPNSHDAANARLNLALSDLATGKLESARDRLKTVMDTGGEIPVLTSAYAALVDAELLVKAGQREEALALYSHLAQRTEHAPVPHGLRSRVAFARGRLLTDLGRTEEARAVYARAEAELEQTLEALPFVRGLDAYVGAQEEGAYALMELLSAPAVGKTQRLSEALDVARRARTRVLRSLSRSLELGRLDSDKSARIKQLERVYEEARTEVSQAETEAWQVPLDELPARKRELAALHRREEASLDALLAELPARALHPLVLEPSELLLGLFQVSKGVRVFIQQDGQIQTRLVVPPERASPEAWSDALFAPYAAHLRRASAVSILADAALEYLDVHALPFEGQPLIARVPVHYRVDVSPELHAARPDRFLIVADARSDLPRAASDGRAMHDYLSLNHATEFLVQGAATTSAVREGLSNVTTAYFAGHSERSNSHAFSAALLLSDEGRLEALDVLSLPRSPERVVLSSCDSAQAPSRAHATGLGLSQAFVLRGATSVLGTTRPVSDQAAAELGKALRDDATPTFDTSHFRRAILRLRAIDKTNEWTSYRVLVP